MKTHSYVKSRGRPTHFADHVCLPVPGLISTLNVCSAIFCWQDQKWWKKWDSICWIIETAEFDWCLQAVKVEERNMHCRIQSRKKNVRYCVTSTSLCALKIDNVRLIEPAVLSGHISQIFLSRNACRSYWVNVSKQIEITSDISSNFLNHCWLKGCNAKLSLR